MPLEVQGQVVRPGEAPITVGALEGLGARVFSVVSRQLVRAGKPPLTAVPRTSVGLLT